MIIPSSKTFGAIVLAPNIPESVVGLNVPVPRTVPRLIFIECIIRKIPYLMRSSITPASMWWV